LTLAIHRQQPLTAVHILQLEVATAQRHESVKERPRLSPLRRAYSSGLISEKRDSWARALRSSFSSWLLRWRSARSGSALLVVVGLPLASRGRGREEGGGHHPSRLWCCGRPIRAALALPVARLEADNGPWFSFRQLWPAASRSPRTRIQLR
jgi:hypothetical protein